jgi:hypothetical protein
MAKWYGKIGYANTVETKPGIWKQEITEYEYFGEVLQASRSLRTADQVNDNIEVANRISILADPFASEHFHSMCYITFMGTKWKISKVEVKHPRLELTLGGVYNGEQA